MHKVTALATAVLCAATIGALGASAASARQPRLTLYAGGQPVPTGPSDTNPFSLTSDGPFTITMPEKGLTVTCTPKHDWQLRGWVATNGRKTDKVRIDEEGELDEVRHCAGDNVAGPQIAGELELPADGAGRLVAVHSLRPRFDMVVGACLYDATELSAVASVDGPLSVSLAGTFLSEEAACPPAEVTFTTPFEAAYEGQLVEAFAS